MKKTATVLLARGFEEIETATIIDILRRADIKVVVASTEDAEGAVAGAHGLSFVPDAHLRTLCTGQTDAVIIPGGAGSCKKLSSDDEALSFIRKCASEVSLVAAICAGPSVLCAAGILPGRSATAYPGYMADVLSAHFSMDPDGREVVVDRGDSPALITSRGPGTAMAFALAVVEHLVGAEARVKIAQEMLFY